MANEAVQTLIALQADENGNFKAPRKVHLLTAGVWKSRTLGKFRMSRDDLLQMVDHFAAGRGMPKGASKLPINFGHDRGGKASGWMTRLFIDAENELWADTSWTPTGKQSIEDGDYQYISAEWNTFDVPYLDPEDEDTEIPNVVTGAGLTNIPLFKKLQPFQASQEPGGSDTATKIKGGPSMALTLEEVRGKKPEELSDEEKTFLETNKAELTDEERTAFGLTVEPQPAPTSEPAPAPTPEPTPAPAPEPNKASAPVNGGLSASEVQQLQADAAAGRKAMEELQRNTLTASVEAGVSRGVIKSDQLQASVEMLMELPESHRDKVVAFIGNLPDNKLLASEIGSSNGVTTSAQDELNTLVASALKDGTVDSYAAGVKHILDTNADLAQRVEAERK